MISLSFILSFVPLLMGLGGNVGNQSATILVRALAINQIDDTKKVLTILRECCVGLIIGVIIGLIVSGYVCFIQKRHHGNLHWVDHCN